MNVSLSIALSARHQDHRICRPTCNRLPFSALPAQSSTVKQKAAILNLFNLVYNLRGNSPETSLLNPWVPFSERPFLDRLLVPLCATINSYLFSSRSREFWTYERCVGLNWTELALVENVNVDGFQVVVLWRRSHFSTHVLMVIQLNISDLPHCWGFIFQ